MKLSSFLSKKRQNSLLDSLSNNIRNGFSDSECEVIASSEIYNPSEVMASYNPSNHQTLRVVQLTMGFHLTPAIVGSN